MQKEYFKIRPLARLHRGQHKHVAAAAAYQSRSKLIWKDRVFDFSGGLDDLAWDAILLPLNAPRKFLNRQNLCDAMQSATNFRDGLMARWIVASLPADMPLDTAIARVHTFCLDHLVSAGMCVDVAIHDPRGRDYTALPHTHILASAHLVSADGFGMYVKNWQAPAAQQCWKMRFKEAIP